MGAERVSELSTHNTRAEDNSSALYSYQKLFEEQCPIYMSMGMSYDEFWFGEPERVKYYRKAHEIKKKQMNEQLWLQGLYIYEAFCDVSPILVTMPKRGAKILPYSETPYALTQNEAKKQKEDAAQRKQKAMLDMFARKADAINLKMKKGGGDNG